MAMNMSGHPSGRTEIKRQIRIFSVLLVVLVALGYAAIPFVDHAVSSPRVAAQLAPANQTPGAGIAQEALETAAAAEATLRSQLRSVGSDRTDHSRECQPEAGINTTCIYN